jgi:hypothetical protein
MAAVLVVLVVSAVLAVLVVVCRAGQAVALRLLLVLRLLLQVVVAALVGRAST